MGDEAVDGSKLGTKLIMFVAIIGLALVAFLVGKSLINTGVESMEQSAKSISDSRFSDYNKKTVKGRAVKSAIENFANEEVAILVCSLKEADGQTGSGSINTSILSGTGYNIMQIKNASAQKSDGAAVTGTVGTVNYNALLDKTSVLEMKNGEAVYDGDFTTDAGGNVNFFLQTENLSKKGNAEYISDSASFKANLIKSTSGEIMGIVFIQKKLG